MLRIEHRENGESITSSLLSGNRRFAAAVKAAALSRDRMRTVVIEGQAGSGKTAMALYFAAALLCDNNKSGEPCGVCRSCRNVYSGNHSDVIIPQKDKKTVISTEAVKALRRDTQMSSNEGGRKFYIFEHAEELNTEGQNALLKLLEEPPPGVYFLLLCNTAGALLPTVISRSSVFRAEALTVAEIEDIVRAKGIAAPDDEIKKAASLANGNAGRALELISSLGDEEESFASRFAEKLASRDELGIYTVLLEAAKEGFEDFYNDLRILLRDALVLAGEKERTGSFPPQMSETSKRLASLGTEKLSSILSASEIIKTWKTVNVNDASCFPAYSAMCGTVLARKQ